jgi:hypothetical protein
MYSKIVNEQHKFRMKIFFGNSKKRISVHQFWALFSKNTVFKWKSLTILLTLYFSDSRHRQVEHWQRGGVLGHLSHERRWDVSRTRNSSISKKKLVIKKLLFSAMFQPSFSHMSKRWINKKLFALNDDFEP